MKKRKHEIWESVRMESFAAEGNGLAHVDGKVLFVPMAVPGDVADIKILRIKKSYTEGCGSPAGGALSLRVAPFCSHFGMCGGCSWQHVPYEKQLIQTTTGFDQLSRIGKLESYPTAHTRFRKYARLPEQTGIHFL